MSNVAMLDAYNQAISDLKSVVVGETTLLFYLDEDGNVLFSAEDSSKYGTPVFVLHPYVDLSEAPDQHLAKLLSLVEDVYKASVVAALHATR